MEKQCQNSLNAKVIIFIILFLLLVPVVGTAESGGDIRLAILDFSVQSGNPDYQYLGKGFAEFISVELDSLRGIRIIDRSKRNEILKEHAFMLSGAADSDSIVEAGQMLAARYLISGDIFEMFGDLVITVKILDIASGEVIASAKAEGEPGRYKFIVSSLARDIYSVIRPAAVAVDVPPVSEEKENNLTDEEAKKVLTGFSEAVDAVDNNDVDTAREKLEEVRQIDKDNKAIQFYLNKLLNISPKFNIELIYYAPSLNPGLLGFIEKDRLYLTASSNMISPYKSIYPDPDAGHVDFMWEFQPGTYYGYYQTKAELGYAFPLGENAGMNVEINTGMNDNIVRDRNYDIDPWTAPDDHVYIRSGLQALGVRLGFGAALSDNFGIGISGYILNAHMNLGGSDDEGDPRSDTISGAASIGIYAKPRSSNWFLESVVSVPFLQEVYIDYDIKDYVAYKTAPYPLVLDTTFIASLIQNRLYLSVKELLEVYLSFDENDDRFGIASRSILAGEFWFNKYFSIRLGGEFDILYLMDKIKPGAGVIGGFSLKLGNYTIDANLTWMERALRFYPGYSVPDLTLLVQISAESLFIKGGR